MLVFTYLDTQVFSDVRNCWIKDGCLFIEFKNILDTLEVNMIPLCNIKNVSGIDINQWK